MLTNKRLLLSSLVFLCVTTPTIVHAENNRLSNQELFQGWQVFAETCGSCHGEFGQGKIAPDLTKNIKNLSEAEFTNVVSNGRGLMPAWKNNEDVMRHMHTMYHYLKGRSTGEIAEGIPAK